MKINIKGPIISNSEQWIYDWFGIDATSPGKVIQLLDEAKNKDIEVDINSGGGSVFDASEIYTALKEYKGFVTGKIVGIAASAASVIAMASDKLLMSPTGQMMVHNASTTSQGDYRDMDKTSSFLQNVNQTIANAYSMKSGKPYTELLDMMDEETWMTPQQALQYNLIDEVMFENQAPGITASTNQIMLPQEVIDKVRNEMGRQSMPMAVNQVNPQKEAEKPMNLEELKNNHPDLYEQVKNEGYQAGVKAENSRIKAVEDVAITGYEELVNKTKFETMDSAETLAMNIIKAQKEQGQTFLNQRAEDAGTLDNVEGSAAPENGGEDDAAKAENTGKSIAGFINKMRGGHQ